MRILFGLVFLVAIFATGCASCERSAGKPFVVGKDNFAFANELKWTYTFHEDGSFTSKDVEPEPKKPHRCFPMVRSAREFFYHARFESNAAKLSEGEYRELVEKVHGRNSRCPAKENERVLIPGYANLFEFSTAHPNLIQDEIGGSWQSFYQRGNWRMIFPILNWQERRTARELLDEVQHGRMPIIHVYRFPDVRLNHGIMIIGAEDRGEEIVFAAYDANNPGRAAELKFDKAKDAFVFERNQYFAGGPVKVYEVYRGTCY